MAWARTWPKVADDEIALEDFNDLNDELNLRAGLSYAAIADGTNLRTVIQTMRVRIHGVLPAWLGAYWSDSKFLNASGVPYGPPTLATCGYLGAGEGPWQNIFEELYAGGRLAWRNEDDGTEATSEGSWYPPKCSLQDSEPYIFHVNELYDVINALVWRF